MKRNRLVPWFSLVAIAVSTSLFAAGDAPKVDTPKLDAAKPKEIEDFAKAAELIVLHASADRLDEMRREALEAVHDRVGLRMPEGKKVLVSLNAGGSAAAALTFASSTGSHIAFNAAVMKRYNRDYKEVFKHELFHAVQDCWWGPRHGGNVPSWIKEGLGTYVGGNGPGRVKALKGNPRFIDGLANHRTIRASDYAEGYLAILFIEKTWGAGGLKKFVRDITMEKAPWEAALKKLTDLEFREFEERSRKFSIEQVFAAADGPPDAVDKELKRFAGAWELEAGERDGVKLKDEQVAKSRLVYRGKEMTIDVPSQSSETIKAKLVSLDPTKTPAQMTWVRDNGPDAGKPMQAIYEFVDVDHYRVCFALGGKDRPTEFRTKAGVGHLMHTWKRAGK